MTTLPFDRPDPLRPPPAYADLRASSPVAAVRTPDGGHAWLVTSYDAVAAVLSDRRFGLAPPGDTTPGNDTLFQDGEVHARLRRLVSKTFNPRSLALLGPRIERLADEHVAALARPADLVEGLATPPRLPLASLGPRAPVERALDEALAPLVCDDRRQIADDVVERLLGVVKCKTPLPSRRELPGDQPCGTPV